MTAQIPYSVKLLHSLAKSMEVSLYPVVLRNLVEKKGFDAVYENAFARIFNEYKNIFGWVAAPKADNPYSGKTFVGESGIVAARITKDIIQTAFTNAAAAFLAESYEEDEVFDYRGYTFFTLKRVVEQKEVVEKTVVVKENNTDEILRAIARSEEQAANFNKTLPDLFPKSKEYDAELDGLKQELEKMRDYFTLLQQKTEQIIKEFNISTTAVNQLIDKAGEENRQLLNQMLQKEYNPVITVEAPEVKLPEIPAPKVEVNVMQVAEEIRVSLRAIVKHLDERLDKMSEPKEVTFKVVYDKDKWPVEVVVKEIN